MKCPSCEVHNREEARFCRNCGQSLEELLPGVSPTAEAIQGSEPFEPLVQGDAAVIALGPPDGHEETASPVQSPEHSPATDPGEPDEPDLRRPALDSAPRMKVEGAEELATAPGTGDPEAHLDTVELADRKVVPGEDAEPEPEIGSVGASEGESTDDEASASEPADWDSILPFSPGTVVGDRYLVTRVLEVEKDRVSYRSLDLARCKRCGFDSNNLDDAFCAVCGAAMDDKPGVTLLQLQDPATESMIEDAIVDRLKSEAGHLLVLADKAVQVPRSEPATGMSLVAGQCSDAGMVRELNEDSLLCFTLSAVFESVVAPVLGLLAVADGMGGHEGGEMASRLALQTLASEVIQRIVLPLGLTGDTGTGGSSDKEDDSGESLMTAADSEAEGLSAILGEAVAAANDAVYLARQKRGNDMGTTLTAALVYGERLVLAHVGDSRAYRWGAEGLEQLTTDHSLVARMIAAGDVGPEEIYTHPQRNVIYRSVGDTPVVEVDTSTLPLSAGDRLLLCSDGLWEMIRDEGIADVMMMEADPQAACERLVARANLAGGDDNISVIVGQIEAIQGRDRV